jgi:hypothetical protein
VDDIKFFVIAGALPLALFALVSQGEWIEGNPDWEPQWEVPTVTFVEEGTPGAISWEEYQRDRYGWETP